LIELGILGDALIGAATSVATYAAAVASHLINPVTDHVILKLSSFAIITGFAGIRLLSSLSDKLVQEVQGVKKDVQLLVQGEIRLERKQESLRAYIRGEQLRVDERYDEAEQYFSEALNLDPDNDPAVIGLAKVYRAKGTPKGGAIERALVQRAIGILTQLIERKPYASQAIYNRACYNVLLGQNPEAISDLKRAIELDRFYVRYAQTDPDLDRLRSDQEFPTVD
jgi:tetratricopeptide (TPR) repeat protein